MQYAKKAGYHVGAKYTLGIGGEMGDKVFEKESLRISLTPGKSNESCGRKSSTADTDK